MRHDLKQLCAKGLAARTNRKEEPLRMDVRLSHELQSGRWHERVRHAVFLHQCPSAFRVKLLRSVRQNRHSVMQRRKENVQ